MHLVSPEELSGLITARLKQQPTVLVALDGRCGSGKTTRVLGPAPLVIVEGSYSHHPSLAPYYDIKVFVTCSAEEQMRRLRAREGKRYLNFVQRWIPLEEEYFTDYAIERNAEMTVVTG